MAFCKAGVGIGSEINAADWVSDSFTVAGDDFVARAFSLALDSG